MKKGKIVLTQSFCTHTFRRPCQGPSGLTGGIAQKLRVTAQRHMEDMTLKIFQSFLTLKKAEASQATKAFVLSVTVTQESARGLTHIRPRQRQPARRGGGTTAAAPAGALALGAKTRAFLIHCCCLSSDSTSHGFRRADADSPPPPPRRLSTSVQSNKLNSSRARNASSSTSRMLQTSEIVAKQHKILWKTTCLASYLFDLKPRAFKQYHVYERATVRPSARDPLISKCLLCVFNFPKKQTTTI